MPTNKLLNWVLFLILSIVWGSSFILMKHSKEELSASQIAAVRIFCAGIVLLPLAILHVTKIPRKKFLFVLLAGVSGNLFPAFLFASAIAENIDSSLASILNSLTPLLVVIIAVVFFRDKIKTQKIMGVFVGFAGLTMLFVSWKGVSAGNFKYASLILLATLSYAITINVVAHFLKEIKPLHLTTVSLACMTIPCAFVLWQQHFFELAFHETDVQQALAEAATLGIVGSAIATVMFYVLIKRAGGLFASLVTYGIPFVGIFWGVADGENITITQVSCLGIILFGVYLVNKPEKKESKPGVLLSQEFVEETI